MACARETLLSSIAWRTAAFVGCLGLFLLLNLWELAGPIDRWRLLRAVNQGDLQAVVAMIGREELFVGESDPPGTTWDRNPRKRAVIEQAIVAEQPLVLEALLRNRAFHASGTALPLWSVAARCGSVRIMQALLDLEGRPEVASLNALLPDCTCYSPYLQRDGSPIPGGKRLAALEFLLAQGADLRSHARSILSGAIRSDLLPVARLLDAQKVDFAELERTGRSGFLAEVLEGMTLGPEARWRWVDFLLDRGVDPGYPGTDGRTPDQLIKELAHRHPHEAYVKVTTRLERLAKEKP